MFELHYIDSYHQERSQTFSNLDELLLAFSGCVTIPDNLTVSSLTYQKKELGYVGKIGDLYRFLKQLDPTQF